MRKTISIFFSILFCFLVGPLPAAGHTYNFTYTFQGHTRGKFFLFIPYRVFYKSSASIDFSTQKGEGGNLDFFFKKTVGSGYMMRTSGFPGKAFVVLTADYDLARGLAFGKKKMKQVSSIAPFYNRYIKKRRIFLFKISSRSPDSIRFTRTPDGIHTGCRENFDVHFQYAPEHLNICFNIYKIMTELLKNYNHPYLPPQGAPVKEETTWQSRGLDFSETLNRVGGLAAKIVKKHVSFKQEYPFHVHYRVLEDNAHNITIQGDAAPQVKIWEQFRITGYTRRVKTRKQDGIIIEDKIHIKIRNRKGQGLDVQMFLNLKKNCP